MRHAVLLVLLLVVSPSFAATPAEIRDLLKTRDPVALAAAESFARAEATNAEAWILLAHARLLADQDEKAIDAASKAVALAPDMAQAHYWLGNAYGSRIEDVGMLSKMSMAPKLRDAYETAVRLDPTLIDARNYLLQFYLQAPAVVGGGIDKARGQAAAIAALDAARGHLAQAAILQYEKKPDAALREYEAAYAARPGDRNIRITLGTAYQNLEHWDQALAFFRAWTEQDPRAGVAWYQLGRIAAVSGRENEAGIIALRTYLGLPRMPEDPGYQHAWYRLGQIYAQIGKKDEARAAYRKALEIDPAFDDAKKALTKI